MWTLVFSGYLNTEAKMHLFGPCLSVIIFHAGNFYAICLSFLMYTIL